MILTAFSIAFIMIGAVITFKLGYVCGQTAERVDLWSVSAKTRGNL